MQGVGRAFDTPPRAGSLDVFGMVENVLLVLDDATVPNLVSRSKGAARLPVFSGALPFFGVLSRPVQSQANNVSSCVDIPSLGSLSLARDLSVPPFEMFVMRSAIMSQWLSAMVVFVFPAFTHRTWTHVCLSFPAPFPQAKSESQGFTRPSATSSDNDIPTSLRHNLCSCASWCMQRHSSHQTCPKTCCLSCHSNFQTKCGCM